MRSYPVPPDMSDKEKVIGGILNINQFFWVLGGLGVGAGMFGLTFDIIGGKPALVLGVLFSTTGLPFVIYKKNGLTLYQYIVYRNRFKKKVHKLPNMRKEEN